MARPRISTEPLSAAERSARRREREQAEREQAEALRAEVIRLRARVAELEATAEVAAPSQRRRKSCAGTGAGQASA